MAMNRLPKSTSSRKPSPTASNPRTDPSKLGPMAKPYSPSAPVSRTGATNLGGYSKPAAGRTDPSKIAPMAKPYSSSAPVSRTGPTNLGGYSKPAPKPVAYNTGSLQSKGRPSATNQMKANAVKPRKR